MILKKYRHWFALGNPMTKPRAAKADPCSFLEEIRTIHRRRCNCRLDRRAEFWLRYGGDKLDISPGSFHISLAHWLQQAGILPANRVEDAAAAFYCLGVTNSNNLFQKVKQGKVDPHGIGKDGKRNGKVRPRAE